MRTLLWVGLVLTLIMQLMQPAAAKSKIYVVDGDSIFIGKREIRLSGIDAPEYHQTCFDAKHREYACGVKSREYLVKLAGSDLHCDKITVDRYHREVADCYSNGKNINREMVAAGWAVAYTRYTKDYAAAEKSARRRKAGIWQGKFMQPEFYRILKKD